MLFKNRFFSSFEQITIKSLQIIYVAFLNIGKNGIFANKIFPQNEI